MKIAGLMVNTCIEYRTQQCSAISIYTTGTQRYTY